jgi:hypothetical protein
MLNREKIKEIMENYPEVADMTIKEYKEFRVGRDDKIPCMTSIYKYFGRWVKFKQQCFDNPTLHRWWENENNVIRALLKHPQIEEMTELEYELYREDKELPSRKTITKYLGKFRDMKEIVFNGVENKVVEKKPFECSYCLYEDICEFDYNLEKCPFYDR